MIKQEAALARVHSNLCRVLSITDVYMKNYIKVSVSLKENFKLAEHHAVMTRHQSPIHNTLGLALSFKTI